MSTDKTEELVDEGQEPAQAEDCVLDYDDKLGGPGGQHPSGVGGATPRPGRQLPNLVCPPPDGPTDDERLEKENAMNEDLDSPDEEKNSAEDDW